MNYPDNSKTRREFVVDYTSLCTSTPRPTTSSSASQTPRPRPTPRIIPRTTSRTTPKPEQGPVSAPTPAPTSSPAPVQGQIRGPRSRLKRSTTTGDALFGKLCVLYKRPSIKYVDKSFRIFFAHHPPGTPPHPHFQYCLQAKFAGFLDTPLGAIVLNGRPLIHMYNRTILDTYFKFQCSHYCLILIS